MPKEQELHIILDNYATHKHEEVLRWIAREGAFRSHEFEVRFFRTRTGRFDVGCSPR